MVVIESGLKGLTSFSKLYLQLKKAVLIAFWNR